MKLFSSLLFITSNFVCAISRKQNRRKKVFRAIDFVFQTSVSLQMDWLAESKDPIYREGEGSSGRIAENNFADRQ
jgi:hypothetical protein